MDDIPHLLWRLDAPLPPADLRLGALDFTLDLVGTLRAPETERCEVEDTGVLEAGEDKEVYCTVRYCTVLYCTVLYCTVLYCTVLYCTVL